MGLEEYFEGNKGFGVLATAGGDGTVDVAVYARPHVVDEETVAFIMADRLSHRNLQSNPHASPSSSVREPDGRDLAILGLPDQKSRLHGGSSC